MTEVFGQPVLIYQMGKVGSTSIYDSLMNRHLPGSLHHIHVLSHQKLHASELDHQATNREYSQELLQGLAVRKYLDSSPQQNCYVITAVREPVSQFISSFFQNLQIRNPDLISPSGVLDEAGIRQRLQQTLEEYAPATQWNCTWFDTDFHPALNIDIYQNRFNHELGYVLAESGRCRVLCLRLESSQLWRTAICRFLGLDDDFVVSSHNDSKQKTYGAIYTRVRSSLRVSRPALQRIYSTKFARHFYNEEMRQKFLAKWSRQLRETAA